jgi:hypothetical protein
MDDRPQVYNRPFTWDFVLWTVETCLGMWVGRPTYERAVALITGFDMAQTESIHGRMQEVMSKRHGTGPIGWPHVLMAEAIGRDIHNPGDLGPLTPEDDARAIAQLVVELRSLINIETAT